MSGKRERPATARLRASFSSRARKHATGPSTSKSARACQRLASCFSKGWTLNNTNCIDKSKSINRNNAANSDNTGNTCNDSSLKQFLPPSSLDIYFMRPNAVKSCTKETVLRRRHPGTLLPPQLGIQLPVSFRVCHAATRLAQRLFPIASRNVVGPRGAATQKIPP